MFPTTYSHTYRYSHLQQGHSLGPKFLCRVLFSAHLHGQLRQASAGTFCILLWNVKIDILIFHGVRWNEVPPYYIGTGNNCYIQMQVCSFGNSLKYLWKRMTFSLYSLYFATFSAISFGGIIDMALYNSTLSPYLPPSKVHTGKLLNWNVRVLCTILFSLVDKFIWWQFVYGNF